MLFGVVSERLKVAHGQEPGLPGADPEELREDREVLFPVVGVGAGAEGTGLSPLVGPGSWFSWPISRKLASRSVRSISISPDRMSSRGTSRPLRRHTSHTNPHIARIDPADSSVSQSTYRIPVACSIARASLIG
jgi:hypothetical protein